MINRNYLPLTSSTHGVRYSLGVLTIKYHGQKKKNFINLKIIDKKWN